MNLILVFHRSPYHNQEPQICISVDIPATICSQVVRQEGLASLWSPYPLLCLRSITYNFGRFLVFDAFNDALVLIDPNMADFINETGDVPIQFTLLKGALAGVLAAALSQVCEFGGLELIDSCSGDGDGLIF